MEICTLITDLEAMFFPQNTGNTIHNSNNLHSLQLENKGKESDRNVKISGNNMSICVDRDNIEGGTEEEGERREEVEGKEGEGEEESSEKNQAKEDEPSVTKTSAGTAAGTVTGTAGENPTTTTLPQPVTQTNPDSQASQLSSQTSSRPSQDRQDIGPTSTTPDTTEQARQASNPSPVESDSVGLASLASNSATQAASAESVSLGESSNDAEGKKVGEEQRRMGQSLTHYFQPLQLHDSMREEGGRGRRESKGGTARTSMSGRGDSKAIASKIATLRVEGKGVGGEKGKGQKKDGGAGEVRKTRSATRK